MCGKFLGAVMCCILSSRGWESANMDGGSGVRDIMVWDWSSFTDESDVTRVEKQKLFI